jgi:hypothetical protein
MGRIFSIKFGRGFGMHNPFGDDIGKARDPFLNLGTLARLSFAASSEIKKAVAENLAFRFTQAMSPRQLMKVSLVNKAVVADALIISGNIHDKVKSFVANYLRQISPEEVASIVFAAASDDVKIQVANSPKCTPKMIADILINKKPGLLVVKAAVAPGQKAIDVGPDKDMQDLGWSLGVPAYQFQRKYVSQTIPGSSAEYDHNRLDLSYWEKILSAYESAHPGKRSEIFNLIKEKDSVLYLELEPHLRTAGWLE